MGIKIKNLQTGEFEKFNIPALKGEKGEPGEIESSEKVDYIGKQHSKLRDTMNANVDYAVKTAIGEFNYLDYEGQHITATNSIEGHARSAILKGQTLVNYFNPNTISNLPDEGFLLNEPDFSKQRVFTYIPLQPYEDNTEYTMIVWLKDVVNPNNVALNISFGSNDLRINNFKNGINIAKGTTKTISGNPNIRIGDLDVKNGAGATLIGAVILKGDYTNISLNSPFYGMQSVKMPVLMATGKNLFDSTQLPTYAAENAVVGFGGVFKSLNNGVYTTANYGAIGWDIALEEGQTYTLSLKGRYLMDKNTDSSGFMCTIGINNKLKNNRVYGEARMITHSYTFVATKTTKIGIGIVAYGVGGTDCEIYDIQLEKTSSATTYEPYKSNILSTPSDLELRGIGDVKDTLDCLTGGVIERIGEVFSNSLRASGALSIGTYANVIPVNYPVNFLGWDNGNLICDKLKTINRADINWDKTSSINGISLQRTGFWFVVDKTITTQEQANEYLNNLNATIQYELPTTVIKTVDLSDNHVYSYKGTTHYSCSSEEGSLVPTLSVKVPTDTQLTIQEQKATTQTLLIKNMDLQQSIKEVQAMNLAFNTALYNSFNSIREEVEDIKKHISTNENLEGSF